MNVVFTDLWDFLDRPNTLIVVTTNSYVTKNNELAMGRGAAKQAAERFSWLPVIAGNKIKNTCGSLGLYGFLDFGHLGIFQVKRHFNDNADLDIVKISALKLAGYYYDNIVKWDKKLNIHMNYPAIGYGNLIREAVEPILKTILPENIVVHMYKEL